MRFLFGKKKKYVTHSAGTQGKWKELNIAQTNLILVFSHFEVFDLAIYCALNVILSYILLCTFPQTFILLIFNTSWGERKNN